MAGIICGEIVRNRIMRSCGWTRISREIPKSMLVCVRT